MVSDQISFLLFSWMAEALPPIPTHCCSVTVVSTEALCSVQLPDPSTSIWVMPTVEFAVVVEFLKLQGKKIIICQCKDFWGCCQNVSFS